MKEITLLDFRFNVMLNPDGKLTGNVEFNGQAEGKEVAVALASAEIGLYRWYTNQTEEAQKQITSGLEVVKTNGVPKPDEPVTGELQIKVKKENDTHTHAEIMGDFAGLMIAYHEAICGNSVFADEHPIKKVIFSACEQMLNNA